jgi:hypothetical protein
MLVESKTKTKTTQSSPATLSLSDSQPNSEPSAKHLQRVRCLKTNKSYYVRSVLHHYMKHLLTPRRSDNSIETYHW